MRQMKVTDSKGRLFGIINVVDLLIILLAAGVVVVGYKFLNAKVVEPAEQKTQLVTMEITKKRESFCKSIKIGDEAIEKVNNVPYGIVKAVSYKPAEEYVVSEIDGTAKKVPVPERFDATVVLEVPVTESVQVGKLLSLKAKHFTGSGYVLAVEDVTAE